MYLIAEYLDSIEIVDDDCETRTAVSSDIIEASFPDVEWEREATSLQTMAATMTGPHILVGIDANVVYIHIRPHHLSDENTYYEDHINSMVIKSEAVALEFLENIIKYRIIKIPRCEFTLDTFIRKCCDEYKIASDIKTTELAALLNIYDKIMKRLG